TDVVTLSFTLEVKSVVVELVKVVVELVIEEVEKVDVVMSSELVACARATFVKLSKAIPVNRRFIFISVPGLSH
ncbi:hypothetical protein DPMN_041578, partial [Dreissena polymorpha]